MDEECENLKSLLINDLINGFGGKKICFIVPSYQRGYRWDKVQVIRLLEDLFEFNNLKEMKDFNVGEFYCLQPIVVKELSEDYAVKFLSKDYEKNNKVFFEVVDGQQRLTTIFILLKYILRDAEPFDLFFERDLKVNFVRNKLLYSIPNLDTNADNSTCADAYYILNSFNTIKEWFKNTREKTGKNSLLSNFENLILNRTKIIWYELDENVDCYSTFKNINNGKIPLTDAELVKAMLLNSKYLSFGNNLNEKLVKQEQQRYARFWDEIQRKLSDNEFWAFVNGDSLVGFSTRMDYLINLIVKINDNNFEESSDYKLFSYFEDKLTNEENKISFIENTFEQLRKIFRTLEDWYNNYKLHNYIGYILTYESDKKINKKFDKIIELYNKYNSLTKDEFIKFLISSIRESFENLTLENINYEDKNKVEMLLMLFNIEELNILHQKFNFYVDGENNSWSIEHIKAQHSEVAKLEDRINFMNKEKESLLHKLENTNDDSIKNTLQIYIGKIDNYLSLNNPSDEEFMILAEQIDNEVDGFDQFMMHRLGNLALLLKSDNSAFNNRPFYEKRNILNGWSNAIGKNIPYATNKAFHKMYSRQSFTLDFTRWTKSDFEDLYSREKELLVIRDEGNNVKGFIKEL